MSTIMLASFCGTGVQASASTVEQYGYSEETLLQAMARKGTTDYESTAAALDQEAQAFAAATGLALSTVEQYGYSESTLLRAMAEKGATDYETAATILDREARATSAPPPATTAAPEPTVTYVAPTSHLSAAHRVSLQELFASAQGYENADVHAFNKAWSKSNIATVQEIFAAHVGTPDALTFEALRTEILDYQDSAGIRTALDKLEAYSGVGYADAESGVENTLTILSQNWALASTEIGLTRNFVFDESVPAANSRDFIIYSLLENAATAGGCAPGYAGRFVRDQLILLCVQASVSS